MTAKDYRLLNEMRALVSFGNVPVVNHPDAVTCCGPVAWDEVRELKHYSHLGRCSVCGAPVALLKKQAAA